MKRLRWYGLPIVAVLIGVVSVWGAAFAGSEDLGPRQWIFYIGGASALMGACLFRRALKDEEIRDLHRQTEIGEAMDRLAEERSQLESAKRMMDAELSRRYQVIHQRESELFQNLMTFHEWMEFPGGKAASSSPAGPEKPDPGLPDPEHAREDCRMKDQAVMDLIRNRTEQLFDDIKQKRYLKDGRFEKGRLTMDMLALMESVARIYQPESENPLLETNVELLLRAVNRIALQMLVVLEQLPLDVKRYSIRNIHDSVQAGLKAYGVYKAANPYWSFLRPVYYLGRYGLGGNPVALGVTWAIGELAKTGAKKLTTHLANRYALNLLHDMVFIVGSEAAGIFGGDFRYRESNWVFGAELTDLIRRFPLSDETLLQGLSQIGNLSLRSEYDRIFFYRCLAARKSAEPKRVDAKGLLREDERREIGDRLSAFFTRHIQGASPRQVKRWKAEVEARLGIGIAVDVDAR